VHVHTSHIGQLFSAAFDRIPGHCLKLLGVSIKDTVYLVVPRPLIRGVLAARSHELAVVHEVILDIARASTVTLPLPSLRCQSTS
jgi:hypothetical protein